MSSVLFLFLLVPAVQAQATPTPNPRTNATGAEFCNGDKGITTALGCIPINNLNEFMAQILKIALGLGGGIAFLLMIVGIFQVIGSAGSPDRLKAGQEVITSAIIGLLLIIFSVFLLELIGVKILALPGF